LYPFAPNSADVSDFHPVRPQRGDYVAVRITSCTHFTLQGQPLGITTLSQFYQLYPNCAVEFPTLVPSIPSFAPSIGSYSDSQTHFATL
jgi:hypothetical protein